MRNSTKGGITKILTPDQVLDLLGVCCDGETEESLIAVREVLDAYTAQAAEIERLKIAIKKQHYSSDTRKCGGTFLLGACSRCG